MLTLISMSVALSVIFIFLSHPLSILTIIILQTLIMVILSGIMNISYWFSYILFLIFIGGMLVLFIYVASLASNEIFFKSSMMNIAKLFIIPFIILIITFYNTKTLNEYPLMPQEINLNLIINKFYFQNFLVTLIIITYLLITLFAVVKITKFNKGPLRTSK